MKQIKISILFFIIMTMILGLVYPLIMTGIAGLIFPDKSGGSLVKMNKRVAGSELLGQLFTAPKYFHPRPSASNYDAMNSGGSNLGPTNKKLIDRTAKKADIIRKENKLSADTIIPADLVLASGSGLDPHISLDSAMLQVPRISDARKKKSGDLIALIRKHTEKRYFNFFGDSFVNVLKLNMELDKM